ncbi:DNA glycosylase [Thelonectria olida]|uniref:Adenine DNA glycosylase n=1 Tax=Thelonectria olida TaxID=1576542 RepID=A0A9P9AIU4_9HYPO|nr:DNA glycosylase [Thelonectria olida]
MAPSRVTRSSALSASRKISSQVESDVESPDVVTKVAKRRPTRRRQDASESDAPVDEEDSDEPAPKRRKPLPSRGKTRNKNTVNELHQRLFGPNGPSVEHPCKPPSRLHTVTYHRPALLDSSSARDALLTWFDSVSAKRKMPWRKLWVNPQHHSEPELRDLLERRAYEVWISEIMLQQTRVAVVIDYWNNWMDKWETIHDLAAADPEHVLSAWRGLGYYSRATRIHDASKLVASDPKMKGLLPSHPSDLEAKVPGVGRYTAGAISSIVFGRAAPMVDGNVLRVLSRQLGLLGNVKTDKTAIDLLWAAADALVKAVAGGDEVSDRPGRWGQALMELGSTVCAPKPNCAECPITLTCRAYGEGRLLASSEKTEIGDIEDLCHLCEALEEKEADAINDTKTKPAAKKSKQMNLSAFILKDATSKTQTPAKPKPTLSTVDMEVIVDHARKFPVKAIKKAVRVEETLVCVIRRSDGQYLIQKRPDKGLLAGLWEFPSQLLEGPKSSTQQHRRSGAISFVTELVQGSRFKHVGELGSVPWLFSHIKLTMHVHLFTLDDGDDGPVDEDTRRKWVSSDHVEKESMGTGMRKCWTLAKDHEI